MPNLKYILSALILFFVPIVGLLISVATVIVFDTITGVYRSVKLGGWGSFNSERLGHVVAKMVLYNMAVITIFILDKMLLGEFTKHWFQIDCLCTKLVALVLMFIELTSIKENIEQTFNFNAFDLLKNAFKRSKELKNDITDLTN